MRLGIAADAGDSPSKRSCSRRSAPPDTRSSTSGQQPLRPVTTTRISSYPGHAQSPLEKWSAGFGRRWSKITSPAAGR